RADGAGHERDKNADANGLARPVQNATEQVPPDFVGTEKMRSRWWQQPIAQVNGIRIMRGQQWRQQRGQTHENNQDKAEQHHGTPAQLIPEIRERVGQMRSCGSHSHQPASLIRGSSILYNRSTSMLSRT